MKNKKNFLEKLLQEASVKWKPLGDLVEVANIGVDKKTNSNEKKVRLLNFVDVFKNQYANSGDIDHPIPI